MEEVFKPICVEVNDVSYHRMVKTSVSLLDFIREELKLKGTKKSCDNGECGACTVIMNDELVYSCQILAVQANGAKITTIEGIATNAKLHPIQEALIDEGAVQCGFCTPGMVLAIKKLLEEYPNPTDEQIRYGLAGNVCRCTGYVAIEKAVKKAAAVLRG
ncbi:(2Fe-2S)-binding protein [Synergistes jonesii]|uniref:(2Fe-2S)-binding protein n=1 Tax=Synergistes jonesii TaxID=2754 RepID=UPI000A64D20E|nr:(2Fe-2S)-binding protein [Synergistes jonesii]